MAQDTFNKIKLSGSTDGKQTKVAATSSPGTTIHTADASKLDEIWLYAYNSDGSDRELTLQWGGTSTPDDDVKVTIPSKSGKKLIIAGEILTNSLVVKAYCASAANVIMIGGFVNRITQG